MRFQNGGYTYTIANFLDFSNGLRSTHTFMSETTTDSQRDAIINRQKNFHAANKMNVYFANKGDYSNQSVTPWLGTAASNDKTKMDLARWKKFDAYLQRIKSNGMLAEMWFFADDSNFGGLSESIKNRLARYAMARTSAYSHTLYVLALEWQEGWSATAVTKFGNYVQSRNPWGRMVSVHSLTLKNWSFSGQSWANFIASQPGNDSACSQVNSYASGFYNNQSIPHIGEEFGILNSNSDASLRHRLWANLAGGAAGSATGSDLKALGRFLSQSKMPFYRMKPANNLVSGGGIHRYVLAETGHHYMVFSEGSFSFNVTGSNLTGQWFDPRNPSASLGSPFSVSAGSRTFTPPSSTSSDWVLWITDSSNLNDSAQFPSAGDDMLSVDVYGSNPAPVDTPVPPTPTPDPAATPTPEPTPPAEGGGSEDLSARPFRSYMPVIARP
jgi:hypothetical protein